jgi:hypothetical protein
MTIFNSCATKNRPGLNTRFILVDEISWHNATHLVSSRAIKGERESGSGDQSRRGNKERKKKNWVLELGTRRVIGVGGAKEGAVSGGWNEYIGGGWMEELFRAYHECLP